MGSSNTTRRRMAVLAVLGFASGVPAASKTLGSTLGAWLLDLGRSVEEVTLFSLVTLPMGLKVLWAPALDRYALPFLGRRRGWLFVLQLLLAAALAAAALVGPRDPGDDLVPLAIACVVVAVLSASQDAVADAYRTDVLGPGERTLGAAWFVNGYRVAMLATGGGALALSDVLPWRTVYLLIAGSMGLCVLGTLRADEPPDPEGRPTTLRAAVVEPWREIARRTGGSGLVLVLLFVALYRLPDFAGNQITTPLLLRKLEFSKSTLALVRELGGLGIAIAGAFAAPPLVARWGLFRAMIWLGVLQAVSNLGFCVLAAVGRDLGTLIAVIAVENFCQGLVGAGFVVCLMALCDRRYSATHYALFTSINFLVGTLLASPMGSLAAAVGYSPAFAITAAAGLPGLLLLPAVRRWIAPAPVGPTGS